MDKMEVTDTHQTLIPVFRPVEAGNKDKFHLARGGSRFELHNFGPLEIPIKDLKDYK